LTIEHMHTRGSKRGGRPGPLRIALVSRELYPLCGGGIGVQVAGACAALAEVAEVTVVTTSMHEPAYREQLEAGREVVPPGVRLAFAEEPPPGDLGTWLGGFHLYSARVLERLRELYPDGGPDLIEFSDYMAEGLVTVQARRALDPFLADTTVCVRLHTSAEMCSVLNGHIDDDFGTKMVVAGERHTLRYADRLLAPGGDVLGTYEHFYGADALAPAVTLAPVAAAPLVGPRRETCPPPGDGPLRFLYLGRLERRKNVQGLVRAFTGIAGDDWRLTLAGGDTDTASLGVSMRGQIELAAAGDARIELVDELARETLPELIDGHDVVVVPSLWECWPSVVLEALARNRPVLATPTGGMVEMLGLDGQAGWLTDGTDDESLAEAVERLIAEPERVERAITSGGPAAAHRRLDDPDGLRSAYAELAVSPAVGARRSPRPTRPPLVSVVIPYYQLDRFVEDAVRSVFDQDYPELDAILVNDGSTRDVDTAVLEQLAERFPLRVLTQENSGLGRARNAGIAQAHGRYVLPLDADNMLAPTLVSRCVEVLERDPELAFVTTWGQYVDERGRPASGLGRGFQLIGNSVPAVLADNIAGDGSALFRGDLFGDGGFGYSPELTSYEDWQLYCELYRAGRYGAVIPERLFVYRVRGDSMVREFGLPNHGRLHGEMRARLREKEVQWLCGSAQTTRL
jgi:glycogen(starch) synthase